MTKTQTSRKRARPSDKKRVDPNQNDGDKKRVDSDQTDDNNGRPPAKQAAAETCSTSRLIIKNMPPTVGDKHLRDHFQVLLPQFLHQSAVR